jgi:hypothetical protein
MHEPVKSPELFRVRFQRSNDESFWRYPSFLRHRTGACTPKACGSPTPLSPKGSASFRGERQ